MKLYHVVVILVVVTAISAFLSFFLTSLKADYSYAGLDTSNMNLTVYSSFDTSSDVSKYTEKAQNASRTGTLADQDLDVGLNKRFSNVWDQFGGSFHNTKEMLKESQRTLGIPEFLISALLILISLFFVLKMGLGWLLDR